MPDKPTDGRKKPNGPSKKSLMGDLLATQSACAICGTEWGLARPELDHIVPRAAGGRTIAENLVLVCANCNRREFVKELWGALSATNRDSLQQFDEAMAEAGGPTPGLAAQISSFFDARSPLMEFLRKVDLKDPVTVMTLIQTILALLALMNELATQPTTQPAPQVINQIVNNITVIEQNGALRLSIDGNQVTTQKDCVSENGCAPPSAGSDGATCCR